MKNDRSRQVVTQPVQGKPEPAPEASVQPAPSLQSQTMTVAKPDQAGGSAMTEYEKRAKRDHEKQQAIIDADAAQRKERRANHPIIGTLVNAFTTKPVHGPERQTTTAWKKGAAGERRVAEVLETINGIQVLHDRIRPGSRSANIDHIAIGPAGIFVIDAKQYKGTLKVRDRGSFRRVDERLLIAERDQTKLIDAALLQVEAVRTLLSDFPEVPVRGVLCFVGADWERLKPKKLKGVDVIWPKGLPELIGATGPHAHQVNAIATHLRNTMRQAS